MNKNLHAYLRVLKSLTKNASVPMGGEIDRHFGDWSLFKSVQVWHIDSSLI